MRAEFDNSDLRRLIQLVVQELATVHPDRQPTKLLWSESEVAPMLGVSVYALKKWRQDGFVEAHSRRRPIVYSWAQVEQIKRWLAER